MYRGMYREMYHGTLYHGILRAENTVVHFYRGTFVPCSIPWYIFKVPWYNSPRYIKSTTVH